MIVNSLCNSFTVTSVPHPALHSHAPHFNATTSGILFIIPILITSDDFFFFYKRGWTCVFFFFFAALHVFLTHWLGTSAVLFLFRCTGKFEAVLTPLIGSQSHRKIGQKKKRKKQKTQGTRANVPNG